MGMHGIQGGAPKRRTAFKFAAQPSRSVTGSSHTTTIDGDLSSTQRRPLVSPANQYYVYDRLSAVHVLRLFFSFPEKRTPQLGTRTSCNHITT